MAQYEVVVGNIGQVYLGNNKREAGRLFRLYRTKSKRGDGRAAHEPVTLLSEGRVIGEYFPLTRGDYDMAISTTEPHLFVYISQGTDDEDSMLLRIASQSGSIKAVAYLNDEQARHLQAVIGEYLGRPR